MSRQTEVIINSPVYLEQSTSPLYITEAKPGDPPGVRGFLKINPAALGWTEILIGGVAFGLVFWNITYERFLLIPASFLVLTGVITATAACTRNSCLVVTSQILNFLNIFSCVIVLTVVFLSFYVIYAIRVILVHSMTTTDIIFVICNILGFIFSTIIFATSCCWCKSRKRVMIVQMNTVPTPVINDTVDHPAPQTSPPAYSPVPSTEPPAYEYDRRSRDCLPSAPEWETRKWKEVDLSRKPIQV